MITVEVYKTDVEGKILRNTHFRVAIEVRLSSASSASVVVPTILRRTVGLDRWRPLWFHHLSDSFSDQAFKATFQPSTKPPKQSRIDMSSTSPSRSKPGIVSPEIQAISLHNPIRLWNRIYAVPALFFYNLLYYAYYHAYDTYIKSEEWTFVYCVLLGAGHALSFLITRWSKAAAVKLECVKVRRLLK